MSGDRGPQECVPGALLALAAHADLTLDLFGDPQVIHPLLAALPEAARARVSVSPATDVVPMGEHPREAIRRRKASSMRLALDRVKSREAAGTVSAGNTGALMGMAHFVLKTLPEVERAPIVSAIPAARGYTHMLDLGANTKATPAQLCQFARMGAVVARDIYEVATPRVGLLNVGEEDTKGHETVQEAHALIGAAGLNYVGFVEGDDIFSSDVDVVVTDGFTGNVALKTMEGVAGLIATRLRTEFTRDAGSRLAAWVSRGVLKRVSASLDPRRYNGACMIGLTGVVVKSHGSADRMAFSRAVELARMAAIRDLPGCVARALGAQRS